MKYNVSEETIYLENVISKALSIAKNKGLKEVVEYLEEENNKINQSYE